jgi:hypothetical protein
VLEACVGWVAAFGFVAHAGAVAAAGVCFCVVGAGGVPVESLLVSVWQRCWKILLTRPNEQEPVLLSHHRSQAGVREQRCPSGRPRNHLTRSYLKMLYSWNDFLSQVRDWEDIEQVNVILKPVAKVRYLALSSTTSMLVAMLPNRGALGRGLEDGKITR